MHNFFFFINYVGGEEEGVQENTPQLRTIYNFRKQIEFKWILFRTEAIIKCDFFIRTSININTPKKKVPCFFEISGAMNNGIGVQEQGGFH